MIRRPPRSTLFPYTSSSDLDLYDQRGRVAEHDIAQADQDARVVSERGCGSEAALHGAEERIEEVELDRKSTRLNSSHSQISYAVFCLKKKKNNKQNIKKHTN